MQSVGDLKVGRQHCDDQSEIECRDGEVQSTHPKRSGAENHSEQSGGANNDGNEREYVHAIDRRQDRREIRADGEEASHAERIEAQDASRRVQAYGEDSVDRRHENEALDLQVRPGDEICRNEVGDDDCRD